ncbi:DUF6973 domain-containing protein [Moheibacter sediminis]|uniref:DUF6973 domain-containing protein n=1 Tax=Moheibacter sediminis TaxID=1434700 RepID=A0A1W1Y826_9FLAO|nr:hypothetical protein [Moheibacter sediminis]SMC32322.1 hypothetical protein SAMN06296427_10175 [Moheibacter sediminis]
MKKIFGILKNLSANLTWKMIKALLSKPLLLLPTVWATIESILFSELNFRESHGGRGAANAFRHAAWNLLIAKNASLFTSKRKAIIWAKYVTDLHEECFPNEPFDHQMDLHNNKIGREVFLELMNQNLKSKKKMIQFLVQKTKSAVGLTDEKLMVKYPDEMVYFQE